MIARETHPDSDDDVPCNEADATRTSQSRCRRYLSRHLSNGWIDKADAVVSPDAVAFRRAVAVSKKHLIGYLAGEDPGITR